MKYTFTLWLLLLTMMLGNIKLNAQVFQSNTRISSVQEVDYMIQQGMYQEALNILTAYLTEFPEDEVALMRRIHINSILGNYALKKQDLETVIQKNPLIALKYSTGKRANMIRLPQVDYSPFASQVSFRKSFYDSMLSNFMYEKYAGTLFNDNLKEVMKLVASGKLQEATSHKEFDQSSDNFSIVHYDLLAVIHVMLDDPDSGLFFADQALTIKPDFSLSKHHMSMIHQSLGLYTQALEEIDQAISIDKDIALYYFTRAQLLEVMDRKEEAMEAYKIAIEYKPNYTESQINLGRLLVSLGKTEQGIKYIKQAAWNQNDRLMDIKMSGINAFINGNYDEAIRDFSLCLEASPDNPIIRFNLAISHIVLNNQEEACEMIESIRNREDFSTSQNVLNYCN